MSSIRDALVALLVLATITAAAPIPTAASTSGDCTVTARHAAFRLDNATISAAANGSATATVRNTDVRIEQVGAGAAGFVRVHGDNPNGYCVDVVVEIDRQITPPAELGSIESVDGNQSATWRAVRDFDREETYTRVAFTLPANASATFAPSTARVQVLEWTGTAKTEASGLSHAISSWFDDDSKALQQRHYTFGPEQNGTTTITIPLRNATTGRTIDEWHATYTLPDQGPKPVGTESTDPVYYAVVDGGSAVQFHFRNQKATVEFVANPDLGDKAAHQWQSYTTGLSEIDDVLGIDLPEVF